MTNYNERLDEVLERYRLHANMAYSEVEDGFHTADEFKDVALPKVLAEAKQAITSLIKELVAEAKIELKEVGEQTPGDMDSFLHNQEAIWSEQYIDQFEQNLLKELEEL